MMGQYGGDGTAVALAVLWTKSAKLSVWCISHARLCRVIRIFPPLLVHFQQSAGSQLRNLFFAICVVDAVIA